MKKIQESLEDNIIRDLEKIGPEIDDNIDDLNLLDVKDIIINNMNDLFKSLETITDIKDYEIVTNIYNEFKKYNDSNDYAYIISYEYGAKNTMELLRRLRYFSAILKFLNNFELNQGLIDKFNIYYENDKIEYDKMFLKLYNNNNEILKMNIISYDKSYTNTLNIYYKDKIINKEDIIGTITSTNIDNAFRFIFADMLDGKYLLDESKRFFIQTEKLL